MTSAEPREIVAQQRGVQLINRFNRRSGEVFDWRKDLLAVMAARHERLGHKEGNYEDAGMETCKSRLCQEAIRLVYER